MDRDSILAQLLARFEDAFTWRTASVAVVSANVLEPHMINTGVASPVRQPPRRVVGFRRRRCQS